MIYTGMMPGALFLLKADVINGEEHTIVGRGLKTKERRERANVVHDVVIPVLRDLCGTSKSKSGYAPGVDRDSLCKQFADLKARLGIRPEIRPYSLRHSTATALELHGVSLSVIAQVLRHKTYATTAKHYISISTDKMLEAVNQLSSPLSTGK